jgi:hypothetical protein
MHGGNFPPIPIHGGMQVKPKKGMTCTPHARRRNMEQDLKNASTSRKKARRVEKRKGLVNGTHTSESKYGCAYVWEDGELKIDEYLVRIGYLSTCHVSE